MSSESGIEFEQDNKEPKYGFTDGLLIGMSIVLIAVFIAVRFMP